jgi:hypothetical protein
LYICTIEKRLYEITSPVPDRFFLGRDASPVCSLGGINSGNMSSAHVHILNLALSCSIQLLATILQTAPPTARQEWPCNFAITPSHRSADSRSSPPVAYAVRAHFLARLVAVRGHCFGRTVSNFYTGST